MVLLYVMSNGIHEENLTQISRVFDINKPAAPQAAGQTLPDATQPLGKIPPFTKIAVSLDQTKWFGMPFEI